jgi:hypothetical protein
MEVRMSNELHADYASGNTLYAAVRSLSGQVWCPAAQAFETWGADAHTADDYDLTLADCSGSRYVGDFDADIPPGSYFVQVFAAPGAGPADGDPLVSSRLVLWTGSGELTAAKLLINKAVMDKLAGAVDYYDDDAQTILFTHTTTDTPSTITRNPG